MGRVLVTGASGFIGWNLVRALAACGDEVTCLVRKTSPLERLRPLGVRLVYGDVTDAESLPAAIAGQQAVYHLSGVTTVLRIADYYRVNTEGIRNVARVCAEQPTPPVLVYVSSLAATGPAVDGRPRTESDPLLPVSHYGRSKAAGEEAAAAFADLVPITVIRPPMVFGDGDRASLPLFKMVGQWGFHLVRGRGQNRVALIHAADLAEAMIRAAERGARLQPTGACAQPGQGCYFATCPEAPAYGELGRMIGAAMGRDRVRLFHVPTALAWMVAAAGTAIGTISRRPLYMNLDRFHDIAAGSWLCSPQSAVEELGFSVRVSLAERLRQTAEWYRQEGWL